MDSNSYQAHAETTRQWLACCKNWSDREQSDSSSCVSMSGTPRQRLKAALPACRAAVGMLTALCARAEACIEELWRECERQPRCVFQIWQSRMEQGQVSRKQAALAEALAEGLRRAQEQQQDAQKDTSEPGECSNSHSLSDFMTCPGQHVAWPHDRLLTSPPVHVAAELACWQGEPRAPGWMDNAAGLRISLCRKSPLLGLCRSKCKLSTQASGSLRLPALHAGSAAAGDGTVSGAIQRHPGAGNGAEFAGNSHEHLRNAPGQEKGRPWSKLDAIFAKATAERHASMQAVAGQAHSEGAFGGASYPAQPDILCTISSCPCTCGQSSYRRKTGGC